MQSVIEKINNTYLVNSAYRAIAVPIALKGATLVDAVGGLAKNNTRKGPAHDESLYRF
jgi:hypothetical protein